jgi:hypothetical protein
MAVIINEFDVQVQPPEERPQGEAEPAEEAPAVALRPQELADVLRHQAERRARLRAH